VNGYRQSHHRLDASGLIVSNLPARQMTAVTIVSRLDPLGALLRSQCRQTLRRAITAIGLALLNQLLRIFTIDMHAIRLVIRAIAAPDLGSLVPHTPQPPETIQQMRHRFGVVAPAVCVFNAQHKLAAMMPRKEPIVERSARSPQMKIPRRTGGKANSNILRHDTHLDI